MQRTRLLLIGAGLAAVVVLFLVLRPGGDDEPAATTEAAPAPATTEAAPTPTAEAAPPAAVEPPAQPPTPPTITPPPVTTIPVVIRGGAPVGGIRRATVPRNRRVRLVVRSDVSDHVHVHGYDLMADVGPGAPARIAFRATIPGQFEVELEDRGLQIAELEVRP